MAVDIQSAENLADYLERMQMIQLEIEKNDSKIDKIVKSFATKPEFYTLAGLNRMQRELENYLKYITEITGDTGKLMATKAVNRFLEKSERRDVTMKQVNLVNRLNKRQIDQRIDLLKMQVGKETNYLKSQIDEFFLSARASGRTRKDVLKELIRAANDGQGLSTGFAKKLKRISIDASRREAQQRSTMEYRKLAKRGELYKWIAVNSSPCPDCRLRAGVVLPWDMWVKKGLPGTGRTVCMFSCVCQLLPESVAEEMFPDVKEFRWDKKNMVLTTASEARTFKAHRDK